ncbi:MAG: coproporphyrinogen III oxidase family protein [Chromatiales bacterium]|nr:MAG: coproporphyrinogen III oxidase family protein [Chromatiales bacterium]
MTVAARLLGAAMRRTNARALRFDPDPGGPPVPAPGRRYLLYLHVPFCESLCPFCSFHRIRFQAARAERYFNALGAEIRHYADLGFEFDEVYVGGGTPTVLPDKLAAILALVRNRFPVRDISVETNPNHLTDEVVDTLQAAGVTRLSVGVQSFDNALLKRMGRYQAYGSSEQAVARLARFRDAFRTLNVDLIFNLPDQGADSFARDLQILRDDVRATQVSFYPLMATEATRERMRREMGVAGRDHEFEFYNMISGGLGPEYQADSAWCFSRGAGMVDEYVVDQDDYVGAGSGAFGYLDGRLTANTFSLREYEARIAAGQLGITRSRHLSRREQLRYHLLMRLFGLRLDKAVTRERFGENAWRSLWPEITALKLAGAVRDTGSELRLTRRGMYYWVVMMREFFSEVNRFREAMREQWRVDSRSATARQAEFERAAR